VRGVEIARLAREGKSQSSLRPHCKFFPTPAKRFTHVHVDLVGLLPVSLEGYVHILTIIDPLRDAEAGIVAQHFMAGYRGIMGHSSPLTRGLVCTVS
jgi:hypothetical protein